jgi:hypothetical protein
MNTVMEVWASYGERDLLTGREIAGFLRRTPLHVVRVMK